MVSINNSSNSVKSYANKGFSGLASGLDTESMVQQMLANTQAKIDKQNALKQQTQWKQDTYRDIITSFHSFQRRFFDFLTPKTNLLSASFYNTKAVSSSSSAVKVTPLGDILNNKLTIDSVDQLATARKEEGANTVSAQAILNVDASKFEDATEPSINVTLDGVTKTISLRQAATGEAVLQNLRDDINKAFGNGININTITGEIIVAKDRQVTFASTNDAQKILGFNGSISNKISLNKSISELNFSTKPVGSDFEFTINGTDFKFDKSNTLNDVIRQVNSSSAGVRISYSSLTDKFSVESTTLGADVSIEMKQTKGNLLTSIFGIGSGSSVTSNVLTSNNIQTTPPYELADIESGVFNISVDGINHAIKIDELAEGDSVIVKLNEKLAEIFKDNSITLVGDETNISLSIVGSKQVKIGNSEIATKLGFAENADNIAAESTKLSEMGLTGTISIGGEDVNFSLYNTVQDLVNSSFGDYKFSFEAGKLSIEDTRDIKTPVTINGNIDAMNSLFNSNEFILSSNGVGLTEINEGSNAIIKINGMANPIERNSNDFNIDGYQISLQAESTTPITLSAENNTDQIFDGLVQFVNEYNGLLEKINEMTSAKATYKDYPPLTDDQKKEMTDKEVEQWEEKSKEGLLAGDSVLNSIASQMRTLMYTKPDGSNIALYDIGITTSNNYMDKGKLVINEDKLKASITQDPTAIQQLFASKDGGIAVELNKLVDSAAKSSVASPGRLVTLAGMKNTATDKKNSLFDKMSDIEKTITRLKARYEMEKSRYWKQFTSLEKVINQTNSQSSWLMNMFGQ